MYRRHKPPEGTFAVERYFRGVLVHALIPVLCTIERFVSRWSRLSGWKQDYYYMGVPDMS